MFNELRRARMIAGAIVRDTLLKQRRARIGIGAVAFEDGERALRRRETLLRRGLDQRARLGGVARHALALFVEIAEIELSAGMALRRGFRVPLRGGGIALLHMPAALVDLAHGRLRLGKAHRRRTLVVAERRDRVAAPVLAVEGGNTLAEFDHSRARAGARAAARVPAFLRPCRRANRQQKHRGPDRPDELPCHRSPDAGDDVTCTV